MAPKANAAQRTIIAQMDTCIDEHGRAKQKLDACVLPGGLACGSSPDVVHVHHQALCTLVGGQRILLQERRDRLEQDILDDDDRGRRRDRPRPQAETSDLLVDRKRQILRANGPVAMMLAIVAAAGAVVWAVRSAAELFGR
jgi:hypothetical protein